MSALVVERVRVHPVTLPLRVPFETSVEREVDRPLLVVEAVADGLSGFGEVATSNNPFYYPDTSPTAARILREHLAPRLLGATLVRPEDVGERLAVVRGWHLAKTGLEGAVLDLWARREGVPLFSMLGGEERAVECGTAIGMRATTGELLDAVDAAVAAGARRVKIKIGPDHDAVPLRAVRERHPDLVIGTDANEGYDRRSANVLPGLDELGLQFHEQPLPADDWVGAAALAERMATPLCLDDGIESVDRFGSALALGALGALNVKAPRMGGWLVGARAEAHCRRQGIPAFVGGLLDSGIGKTFSLSLATRPGFVWAADATPSAHHFERDLVDPPVTMEDGLWRPPAAPGIGVEVDTDRIRSSDSVEVA